MYSEINDLKIENQDLKMKLGKVTNEYQEYKKLWNEEESLNKLLAKEKEFMDRMNEAFTIKTQKIM
jgi:predicted nuclease with TOPRIM domain